MSAFQQPTPARRGRGKSPAIPPAPSPAPRPLCIACMSRNCVHFDAPPPRLSPHLVRIVQLLTGGLSNKEIATKLNLTEGTVKTYLSTRIFPALGLTTRLEVALWGMWHAAELQDPDQSFSSFIGASFSQASTAGDGPMIPTEEAVPPSPASSVAPKL
jgi:DNA-binding CsgD family transcriptional regulator